MDTQSITGTVLQAAFFHEWYDKVRLDISISGPDVAIAEIDGHDEKPSPDWERRSSITLTLKATSVYCPFGDLIRFLEALLRGESSVVDWDEEGPHGCMRWTPGDGETGELFVEWFRNWVRFGRGYRVRLDGRLVVRTIYQAFRAFVETGNYRPEDYEWQDGQYEGSCNLTLRMLKSPVIEAFLEQNTA